VDLSARIGKKGKKGRLKIPPGCGALCLGAAVLEFNVPRMLFAEILRLIADLRPRSPPLPA
jgi:hypothetical protein